MYEIRLSVFEGPLDLLLNLIEKKELDITTVSLMAVTEQYLEHLTLGEQIDPENLGSFLVVAAKLLLIKSQSLLPRPVLRVIEDEEDAGEELARLLMEYRKYKLAAVSLREIEQKGLKTYPRLVPLPMPRVSPKLEAGRIDFLFKALEKALVSKEKVVSTTLAVRVYTVEEKMEEIETVLTAKGRASFTDMLFATTTRQETIVLFLALLQLLKGGRANAVQRELFSDIVIYRTQNNDGLSEDED